MPNSIKTSLMTTISVALLISPACSYAANLFAPIGDFNAIVFGNARAIGGDTEGRLAVGGNFYAESYSVGTRSQADSAKNSLIVGGNLEAKWNWQVFNGNTKYGGNLVSSPSTVAPYTISKGNNLLNFSEIESQLKGSSTYLSKLTGTGTQEYKWSTYTLDGKDPFLNVFNVNANDWAIASDRQIFAPAGSTVLINVSGTSGSISSGLHLNGVNNTNVIYNYYEATTLNVKNIALLGSLLAPNANLTLESGNINGVAAIASLNQINGGEFHNYQFNGSLPAEVPEPSTLLATLGLLAGIPFVFKSARSRKG